MWRSTLRSVLLVLFASATAIAVTGNDEVRFSSGGRQVALVELFTSEGCSSCPPADRWMSNLKNDPGLWRDFAPIALHVDYWDYIGWEDRFAQPAYSSRQRRYVQQGGARFVYTPGLFLDGREWQGWRAGGPDPNASSPAGTLNVVIEGTEVAVHFAASDERASSLTAHVAVLGMNLESRVRAGENAGRTLVHDFVALGTTSVPLDAADGAYRAATSLPATSAQSADRAVVVWVSKAGRQAPIQSAGGFLPAS